MNYLGRTITFAIFLGLATVPIYGNGCLTDADCEDGLFCTWNSCDVRTGICGVITTCPAVIIDCVEYGSCDEENDECLAIPLCESEEVCAPDDSCVSPGQGVGSEVCRQVQQEAQQAVLDGSPFKNHGQMVSTAARVVSRYEESGVITEDCSSCVVNQFAKRVPLEEQETCGPVAVCPIDIWGEFGDPSDVCMGSFYCDSESGYIGFETGTYSGTNNVSGGLVNSNLSCAVIGPGPAICYWIVSGGDECVMAGGIHGPPRDRLLTPDEMQACDQDIREYFRELDDLGVLWGQEYPEYPYHPDDCPPLEP